MQLRRLLMFYGFTNSCAIGLCCVYVVFLVAYPYEFISKDVDAHEGG